MVRRCQRKGKPLRPAPPFPGSPSGELSPSVYHSAMRWIRRVLTTVIVLLIASAANFYIAWGRLAEAVAGGTREIPATILSSRIGAWPEPSPLWPAPHAATVSCKAFDSMSYVVRAQWTPSGFVTNEANPQVTRFWQELRVGVPFRCASQNIRQENWHVPVPPGHVPAPRLDDGVPVLGINMPYRPIWPGFIANTGVIALPLLLALWLLGHFMRWLAPRRRLRVAKGLCGACGHDRCGIAGDKACPECGSSGLK